MNLGKLQMLSLVLNENQSNSCVRLIKERGIQGGVVIIGRGTVSSTVLNMLGIKNQRKILMNVLLKREKAKEVMDCLDKALHLNKPNHGIAYTTPVLCATGLPGQEANQEHNGMITSQDLEEESMFKKLTVIVDRGMSGDVMDIALKAGVRGGTILHGRGAGADMATNLFGIEIEPEKELVIILMPNDLVEKVVPALTKGLQLDEPGKGILFVEPIIETRGLFEMR
ncbi:MAG: P-II family nitrogen regulator [Clostridiales bacterium]|nr:P-II family nitrogen regulator [Clostridiales bacterium]